MAAIIKEIRIDDETVFRLTVKDQAGAVVDLSDPATTVTLRIKKPSGAPYDVIPQFETDGADGKLLYQFGSGELDIKGLWHVQVCMDLPNVGKRKTTITPFEVFPNL